MSRTNACRPIYCPIIRIEKSLVDSKPHHACSCPYFLHYMMHYRIKYCSPSLFFRAFAHTRIMSILCSRNALLDLSPALILTIGNLVDKKSKVQLATTNKKLWQIFTYVTDHIHQLEGTICVVDLYKIKYLSISNRYYDERFLKHVLLYARNLKTIFFVDRHSFPAKFMKLFIIPRLEPIEYIVPDHAVYGFRLLAESKDLNEQIIISKANTDTEMINDTADNILTPEHINKHVKIIKDQMKRDFLHHNRSAVKYKKDLSHQVPLYCNQLFKTKDYTLLSMGRFKNQAIGRNYKLDLEQANELVKKVAPVLMESVIILKDHWFLLTSYSVFVHDPDRIDDCADKTTFKYQEEPIACIERKTGYSKESFELSYKIGYIEILANGGFIGSLDSTLLIPFAGLALQNLPKSIVADYRDAKTNYIFISHNEKKYKTTNRIINQYYKSSSTVNWQFDNLRFYNDGFKPHNPLSFTTKQPWQDAASFILRCYAFEEINIRDVNKMLKMIRPVSHSKNPKEAHQLVEQYLTKLKSHHREPQVAFDHSKEGCTRIRKHLIKIYQDVLAPALKQANKKIVSMATKKYQLQKINLFD